MNIKHFFFTGFIFTTCILSAQESVDQSEFSSVIMKGNAEFIIKNLDVNSENQDFGTVYYKDKIVFTSSRPSTKFIRRVWNLNDLPFLDLYSASVKNSELERVKSFNKDINEKYHEGPASFNEAGNFMAFTRNNYEGKSHDDIVKLQLYTSKFEDGEWTTAEPMRFNSNEYSVGHPSLTSDGNTMYFASDMPGGYGGVDIYVTTKNEKEEWSDPKNLGNQINTSGNEMFPFIYKNDCLFFASAGHNGMGGLDLFFSKKTDEQFTVLKNIGSPINSNKDDFAFIIDQSAERGYFSSNRDGGKGDDDIYSFILVKPAINEIAFKGKVIDDSGNNLTDTYIVLYDGKGNQVSVFKGDENGEFNINVQPEVFYKLEVKKDNFKPGELEIYSNGSDTTISHNLVLERIYRYTFTFHLIDQHSKVRIENAKIRYTDKLSGKQGEIFTDDKGVAVITPGNYKLNNQVDFTFELSKEGYLNKSTDYKVILQQEENMDIEVEMMNFDMVSDTTQVVITPEVDLFLKGKVLDNIGKPLADADLILLDGSGEKVKSFKSDQNGEFSIIVDRDQHFRLEGVKEKYIAGYIAIDTHTEENEIKQNLTLNKVPEFNIICHVMDFNTKEFISGIKVHYENTSTGISGEQMTDQAGKSVIKIENQALKDVVSFAFTFQKEGYVEKSEKFSTILMKEGDYNFEIEMQKKDIVVDTGIIVSNVPPTVLLKGKVADMDGNIIGFATIIIKDDKGNKIELKSDGNGEYMQTILRDTYYKLEGYKEHYQKVESIIYTKTVENEVVKDLVLEPIPEFYLVYRIVDGETKMPIDNVDVYYESSKTGVKGNSVSDKKGMGIIKQDGFQQNETSDYLLKISKEGYEDKTVKFEKLLDKAGNYNLDVELYKIPILAPSVVHIVGKVLDTENLYVSGAKVSLYDYTGKLLKHVITDQEGVFHFEYLHDQTCKLEAIKDKYHPGTTIIETQTKDTLISINLFLAKIPEPVYDIELICIVKDKITKAPIKDTKVTLRNKKEEGDKVLPTNDEGTITFTLKDLKLNDQIDYSLTFENDAYSEKTIDYYSVIKSQNALVLTIELQKFEIGEDLANLPEMNPIYFDFDKNTIRDDAAAELDKIVKILNDYQSLEIVLSSYTDCRGSNTYNIDLSNKRAKATADYIKKRISRPERITAKGFGETNLVNDCNCEENHLKDCSEEQHQQNRRTEFKVIKK